jgi:hypothetical protein
VQEIVDGRLVVTLDRWSVRRKGGFVPDPQRHEHPWGGPALFPDEVAAVNYAATLEGAEPVRVIIEMREASKEEHETLQERERGGL